MNNAMNDFGVNDINLNLVVNQLEELKIAVSDLIVIKSKTLIENSYDKVLQLISDIENNVKTILESTKRKEKRKELQDLQNECSSLAMDIFGDTNYNFSSSDYVNDDDQTKITAVSEKK